MKQSAIALALLVCAWPAAARAQTQPTILDSPVSARVAALGNAWVAGRDQDVVFSNPAQLIGVRTDFNASLARLSGSTSMGALTSAFAGGKLSFTLGWGGVLVTRGDDRPTSTLAVIGGAVQYKGFRGGVSGKYVSDPFATRHGQAILMDFGLARNFLSGAAAVSFQNVGVKHDTDIRKQAAIGWSVLRPAGPLDLGLYTQVTMRKDWTAPAAGLEASYSWLEGYLVTLRAGLKRAEDPSEKPVSLGAAFGLDRISLEYALQMFDNSRRAHRMTIRWR
jgi:hypothetical protein